MKTTRCLAGLAILLSSCTTPSVAPTRPAAVAPPVAGPKEAVAPDSLQHPFLWHRVGDGDNFYLFGTIHTGVDAKTELPKTVWQAIEERPCFITETDLSEMSETTMSQYSELPKGQSLRAMVSPETWKYLTERLKTRMAPDQMDHMKPWAVILRLYSLDSETFQTAMMDASLTDFAIQKGKQRFYFETVMDQLQTINDVFTTTDLEEYRRVAATGDMDHYTAELIASYRKGDEKELLAQMETSVPGAANRPEQLDKLLFARNKTWIQKMRDNPQFRQCFIAVGVGHLIGPKGLVAAFSP